MAGGVGVNSKLAIAKGATWNTLIALGTNHWVALTGSSLKKDVEWVEDEELKGKATMGPPTPGAEPIRGALRWHGDYRQAPHMLMHAILLGSAGAPTLVETGVYLHVMKFQPTIDGLFASVGVDLAGKDVHGFKSVKPTRGVITIAGAGRWQEEFDSIGAGFDATISSGAWTYRYDPNGNGARKIVGPQVVVRANTHAGGALGGGDVVKPRRIVVEIARAQEGDFPVGQTYMEEPILSGWSTVRVTLEFHAMTPEQLALFRDNRDANTPLKMDIKATHGTLLGSTQFRQRNLYFPKIFVRDCPTEIDGPGPQPLTVSLEAVASDVLPTGFPTGYTNEVIEEAQFELSTDLLA
jgi:hypothetical protein